MDVGLNKGGIFVPLLNRGKEKKLVPWKQIKRDKIYESVKHCTSEKHNLDLWLVEKTLNGKRLERLYLSERDALVALDIFLIQNGEEPRHILKRTT